MYILVKNRKIFIACLCIAFLSFYIHAETYFVSSGNPSDTAKCFLTIQEGIAALKAGDSLVIRGGAYTISSPIIIEKSGQENGWITILSPSNEKVIINGEAYRKETAPVKFVPADKEGIVTIQHSSYIRIENIGVKYSRSMGFCIRDAESHHIELLHCYSEGTYSCGIGVKNSEHIRIIACEIVDANNLDYSPVWIKEKRHEAPHEAISLMGAKYFEVAYNHLHMCTKEGIDCKETSAYGTIHHNVVHDLYRQGIYIDSWFGRLHHVEVFENTIYDCEWGIVVSSEGKNSEMDSVGIHHNIIYDNRASGIQFGVFGHDEKRRFINVYNNTLVNNGSPAHWAGLTGGIDVRSSNLFHITIYQNVCANNYGFPVALSEEYDSIENALEKQRIIITRNVCFPMEVKPRERNIFPHATIFCGADNFYCELTFCDYKNKDFRIKGDGICESLKQANINPGAYSY
jgi:hypothetical protein